MHTFFHSDNFRVSSPRLIAAIIICSVLGCSAGERGQQATGADKPLDGPATVAQAAKILDLSSFPRPQEAKTPQCCQIASLSYHAISPLKSTFEFQQKQLLKQNWKELPNSFISDQTASAAFTRNGFTLSVTVSPMGEPGTVLVSLTNHGNIDLNKLPVPAGAKSLYAFPVSAAFITESPVDKTAEECRKLLLAKGWQPYGKAGDSLFFKHNAVRLLANILAAPAQGGKTVITYSSELLSTDLPAPEETQNLQYADITKTLSFDSRESEEQIVSFYVKTLSKDGWQPTTEKPIQIDKKKELIFRNPTKDMLTLELKSISDDTTRVKLVHLSSAEIDILIQKMKEQQEQQTKGEKETGTIIEKE